MQVGKRWQELVIRSTMVVITKDRRGPDHAGSRFQAEVEKGAKAPSDSETVDCRLSTVDCRLSTRGSAKKMHLDSTV